MNRFAHLLPPGFLFLLALCASLAPRAVAAPDPPAAPKPNYADAPEMRRLLHWDHFPLHVYLVPGDLATKERTEAVQAGFDQWVHATRDFIHYQIVTKPAQAEITVTFLPNESVPEQGGSFGHTTVTFLTLTLNSANIVLATTDVTPADLRSTAAHEFGHALGMDGHSDDEGDLMYAVLTRSPSGDLPLPSHTISIRDLNTLKVCYPALAVSAPLPAQPAPDPVPAPAN